MTPEPMPFQVWQTTFAARIRDPRGVPRPPGVPARRMRVYEELLFNNLEGFLLACYPVTRRLLGAARWRLVVRRFFAGHRCHSPLFRDIAKSFLDWMQDQVPVIFPTLPFLTELMHYEWLELAVEIAPDAIDPDAVDPAGDIYEGRPVLNPTARLACYRYPVHRIGPRWRQQPPDSSAHCYLIFRTAQDEVRFVMLTALAAQLLIMLKERRLSGRDALLRLAEQTPPAHLEAFLAGGSALLRELRCQGALLGTWQPPGRMQAPDAKPVSTHSALPSEWQECVSSR